jgi:hypothetical protein
MTIERIAIKELGSGKYEVDIKPCRVMDLASFYGISRDTMRGQIKHLKSEIGERCGQYFTIEQVRKIIHELGIPRKIIFDTDEIRES